MSSASRRPRLSIGLPVYNGQNFLAAALESLLAQTYADFELIICDNASTDGTRDICEDFARRDSRIRLYREAQNTGSVRNHNRTIELAVGGYFKWAAHDDIYHPEFLQRCVERLDSDPGAVLVFSRTQFIDSEGRPLKEYRHPLDFTEPDAVARALQYVYANHIMVEDYGVVRMEALRRTPLLGNYVWSDMVLFAELALHGGFVELPEILFFRREHPDRAMYANKDAKSLAAWNDPRKGGKRTLPTWRVLAAHLALTIRAPLTFSQRLRLAYGILRRTNWCRDRLSAELWSALRPTGWKSS